MNISWPGITISTSTRAVLALIPTTQHSSRTRKQESKYNYRVGQKSKPLLIYQQIVLKPAEEATFSLKLNVEQATEVNANKHLLVLNILSIKYSMYDVK